jgi:hypothetical protein
MDKAQIDRTLTQFGRCTLALCDLLHADEELGEIERLFIDNHIAVLHMAYSQWQRKHQPPPEARAHQDEDNLK